MKRYRLLKDLPGFRVGSVFNQDDNIVFKPDHPDWFEEVKEPPAIPEDQTWVVVGKKYRWKGFGMGGWSHGRWFMPVEFQPYSKTWVGLRENLNSDLLVMNKEYWEEYVEPEKPKRKAPAYFKAPTIYVPSGVAVTTSLFSSKEEAKDCMPDTFLDWPALPDSEGYYPGPKGE